MKAGDAAKKWLISAYRGYWFYLPPSRRIHRSEVIAFFSGRPRGQRVLEIGGGAGMMEATLQRACRPDLIVCSDLDPSNATDVVCDAFDMPFADSVFDVVAAMEVLEHLPDTDRFLGEARRVLKPGGHLVISVPFILGVHDFRDFYRFTDQGLAQVLERHALGVARLRKIGGISVSMIGLATEHLRSLGLGQREGWRLRKGRRQVSLVLTTVATFPLVAASWAALALDSIVDRDSKSPAGFLVIAEVTGDSDATSFGTPRPRTSQERAGPNVLSNLSSDG